MLKLMDEIDDERITRIFNSQGQEIADLNRELSNLRLVLRDLLERVEKLEGEKDEDKRNA